jgi:hypothetical protein
MLGDLDLGGVSGSGAFARVFGTADSVMTSAGEDPTGFGVATMSTGSASDITTALFGVPCHVLPPMQTLVGQFMQVALGSALSKGDGSGGGSAVDDLLGAADDGEEEDGDDAAEGGSESQNAAMDTAIEGVMISVVEAEKSINSRAARPSDVEFMEDFWSKPLAVA